MASGEDAMDAGPPSNGAAADHGKGPVLMPVPLSAYGEGLPYAPQDWPLPGDKWMWRVGRRLTQTGYFQDRFLYPPARLEKSRLASQRTTLCSKSAFEQFVRKHIPGANFHAVVSTFIWRIPSRHANLEKELQIKSLSSPISRFPHANGRSDSKTTPKDGECKVGNSLCHPRNRTRKDSLPIMDCDICDSENYFCHDCCCILCCKTIDWAYGGYSFIKCEAVVGDEFVCGHIAHLDCALRAYLAGTVRGSICLNAEYYCRRCDNRTDLVTHLTRLLSCCKCVNSPDETEKILKMGLCILRDSDRYEARKLQALIESMLVKLKDGVNLEEVWDLANNISTITTGFADDIIMLGTLSGPVYPIESWEVIGSSVKRLNGKRLGHCCIVADYDKESSALENKVDQVLLKLKQSQEWEYNLAEEKLNAQRDVILGLYKKLKNKRPRLDSDSVCDSLGLMTEKMMQEHAKLDLMLQVSRGFGETPKQTLKELFGLQILD